VVEVARVRIFTTSDGANYSTAQRLLALIGGDGVADTAFHGGARTAVGDINGDGNGDLIFAWGPAVEPRIAILMGLRSV